jgi:hypothetical protein
MSDYIKNAGAITSNMYRIHKYDYIDEFKFDEGGNKIGFFYCGQKHAKGDKLLMDVINNGKTIDVFIRKKNGPFIHLMRTNVCELIHKRRIPNEEEPTDMKKDLLRVYFPFEGAEMINTIVPRNPFNTGIGCYKKDALEYCELSTDKWMYGIQERKNNHNK